MDLREDVIMNYKIFGAVLVIVGCTGWGIIVAAEYRKKIIMI